MKYGIALTLSLTAACSSPSGYPDIEDVVAVTEVKPPPSADILTNPASNDRYNSALEGWGERLHAAGMRLCRFYERTGMPNIECGK